MRSWLVVEDEPDIYDVLHTMFRMWGVEGIAYNDGEEAVAFIDDVDSGRFRGELPELALLDIRLPGKLDGVAVAARLRKSPRLSQIAIVLISAYVLLPDDQKSTVERAGADLFIRKPMPRPTELRRQLEAVVESRRQPKPGVVTEAPLLPALAQTAPPPPVEKRRTGIFSGLKKPRPPILPEIDEDETREQTQPLPRLHQAETDTQTAGPGLPPDPAPGDE